VGDLEMISSWESLRVILVVCCLDLFWSHWLERAGLRVQCLPDAKVGRRMSPALRQELKWGGQRTAQGRERTSVKVVKGQIPKSGLGLGLVGDRYILPRGLEVTRADSLRSPSPIG
jgi:hypothetical protein